VGEGPPIDWTLPSLVAFHWDGTSWTQVAVPPQFIASTSSSPGTSAPSVFGLADGTVWIVGYMVGPIASQDYVLEWDGSALREILPMQHLVDLPSFGGKPWGSGPDDVWVPVVPAIHFDGKAWTPITGDTDFKMQAITGTSASNVWFVGQGTQGGAIRHWDGSAMSGVLDTNCPFWDVAATPQGDYLWVVGEGGATLRIAVPPAAQ
jgi:hypothetical protein